MISIDVDSRELDRLIEQEAPGWSGRVSLRKQKVRKNGRSVDPNVWSEVKSVYMVLQNHKCAYCERPMAEGPYASIEYDVEHFRPKNRVMPWPDAKAVKELRIQYEVRSGNPNGYPMLVYEPRNYVVTCKVCNSPLKADHFPIEGEPSDEGDDIAKLDEVEKPLLIFPLGMNEPAPEDLITFEGILPVPVKSSGYDRKRAQVTIDFFRLHLRTDLRDARAHLLVLLWEKLERAKTGTPDEQRLALEVLAAARKSHWPHSRCARAFLDLYEHDPLRAKDYYLAAHALLVRKEPGLYGGSPRS